MTIKSINAVNPVATAFLAVALALVGGAAPAPAATPLTESHLKYAIDLGSRGAVYSAQSEFVQVLQITAQSRDSQTGGQTHAAALNAGLTAFAEADDFHAALQGDAGVDLTRRVAMHRTPVLKQADMTQVSPVAAMQAYYDFGKRQLAAAAGNDPLASSALYGLARMQGILGGRNAGPKAVALHQASLLVNPNNYLAANELGVLLFRYGQSEDARSILIHSVRLVPRSETWHNLAVVNNDLGRTDEAQLAQRNCDEALAAERTSASPPGAGLVYWVDKERLTNMPPEAGWDAPTGNGAAAAKPVAPPAAENTKKNDRSFSSLLPWSTKETK